MTKKIDGLNEMDGVAVPAGFVARPATLADAAVVTDVLNAAAVAVDGTTKYSLTECLQEWQTPGFEVETSSCLVFEANVHGRVAGYIEVWDDETPPTRITLFGATHPDYWGQGVGTFLLDWGAQRARTALARVPDDVRVSVLLGINAAHEPSRALMEGWGMTMTRAMYRMAIDLDAAVHHTEPTLPDDLRLTTLAEHGADRLPEIYRAYNDSFRDHWGHVERPEAEGLKQFRHRTEDPDFDPALWFLLVDKASDEIAAVALCMPKSNEDPTIGHVDLLGVRRPWRRRGLGLLLLQQVFCTFAQKAGFRQVALNVDAQSLTGATRLYEKAGMRVERTYSVYEKEIRHGREISVTAVEIHDGETT